ncbi:MAG: hypothetical protein CBC01_09045 [Betaproteobacteria bacterium TMED41]|nr:MAG: hypothetical protein CBC01_09045 [Betaproteobacteria bacterium TMED41]
MLEKFEQDDVDNGIEDTFDSISIAKPKKLAFVQFCSFLSQSQSINLEPSPLKKSKKTVRLSKNSKKALVNVRKKLGSLS